GSGEVGVVEGVVGEQVTQRLVRVDHSFGRQVREHHASQGLADRTDLEPGVPVHGRPVPPVAEPGEPYRAVLDDRDRESSVAGGVGEGGADGRGERRVAGGGLTELWWA